MKRCPQCRRDYYDETLLYCLDDGTALVDGPRSDEDVTKILPKEISGTSGQNAVTAVMQTNAVGKRRMFWLLGGFGLVAVLIGAFVYATKINIDAETPKVAAPGSTIKLYWEMSDEERSSFITERATYIQGLIGDKKNNLDDDALKAITLEVDFYLKRKDSLSQKQFEEGLRAVYGRGTQYAPLIIQAYEKNKVPPALGLYQAMIESEFHDCPPPSPGHRGPVGMFQFSTSTAKDYGLTPADYCSVDKQADAAARHMSDLASDFGDGNANASLGLLSYMYGGESVREFLRQLRRQGIAERSFWAIFHNRKNLDPPLDYVPPDSLPQPLSMQTESLSYVPRFFAAAIIGETPAVFGLSTPPLTTIRN